MHRRGTIYFLTYLAAALSLGHHLDHMIRGNAVGWPLTGEFNAFTVSLGIYPVLATGLLLYGAGRVGPGFWALLSGGGAAFASLIHFGPTATEPPHMIHGAYEPAFLGWIAFGWLLLFVGVLIVTSVYEARAWYAERRERGERRSAAAAMGVES
jgi:heme exporter protein D